jgi:SAM-dependent methyltransferase
MIGLLFAFSSLMGDFVTMEDYGALIGTIDPIRKNIKTLNNCGSTYFYQTELTHLFLEKCRSSPDQNVLEIGCAYGVKSAQIVQTGVSLVVNDIDERHIQIMKEAFAKCALHNSYFVEPTFIVGDIVNLKKEDFGEKKFDAILIESVLHFFTPDQIYPVLSTCYELLTQNGEIYITVCAPFVQHIVDVYEENKKNGNPWPGFILDPEKIHPNEARLHKPYLFFDSEVLTRELTKAGFEIIFTKYVEKPHQEHDMALDGREGLIAIARKT